MSEYDKMVTMYLYTGKIPARCIDALQTEARRQINASVNEALDLPTVDYDDTENGSFEEYALQFNELQAEWPDNFIER